jgi:DNA invertase Pin-like site-specific DNA recombinase
MQLNEKQKETCIQLSTAQSCTANRRARTTPQAVIYVRISTADQNAELQRRELLDAATRMGREITHVYEDAISGIKARRPGLDELMQDAHAGKFDCVLVWKLDRFGRNLLHCLGCIEELQDLGIRFIAVTQALDVDSRNPASKFLLHVLAAAAEFERSLIQERTAAGKARYRQDYAQGLVGKTVHSRSGRDLPPHRPKKIFNRDSVIKLRTQGLSLRKIAQQLGIGLGTVVRSLHERSKSL